MTTLYHDFETKSIVDLIARGLSVYSRHPSTKPLMLSWALGNTEVRLWQCHQGAMPAELKDALTDPHVTKSAWNMGFERAIFKHTMKFPVVGTWRDTAIKARYLSLPSSLGTAGPIVGIDEDKQKHARGKALIRLFSAPNRKGEFNNWKTHPEEWEEFCRYCINDTEAERAIAIKTAKYVMPDYLWDLAEFDARVNARGLPVDKLFCENALEMATKAKKKLFTELQDLTGLQTPTGQKGFLNWAKVRGYPFGDLRKATVSKSLDADYMMDDELILALKMRANLTKTATSKYKTILAVEHEGLFRDGFVFYGAQRTGRWSGAKVQPHNMKKPDKLIAKNMEYIIGLIHDNDYDTLEFEFGNPVPVLGSTVRAAFRAREGKTFRVGDLNAIENRGLGWLAGCKRTLKVFEDGLDPYKAFGVHLYNKPYDKIDGEERDKSKPAVLGAGYRLGGGNWVKNKAGDMVKSGLWGYGESMGIKMTQEESAHSVKVYRELHPDIVKFWYDLEDAVRLTVLEREPTRVGHLRFDYFKGFLRMLLPSGRHLYYLRPEYKWKKFAKKPQFKGDKNYYWKECLSYEGVNQTSKQWSRIDTHGGKLAENATQAISMDILAHGLLLAEKDGFYIVGHVHDEGIAEQDKTDRYHTQERLCQHLATPIKWAPGLPLAAKGYESPFYKKD